ncbi:MAG: UDP-glucose 4-epimerase GalE [Ruminococcaceae bacterium]|nr:UDP-glucose 4-epimerase GalE [Oscillospiraceae bacterium]
MAILITGGTGFIGSHTVVELIEAGREVVIVDNFSNSKPVVLDRIEAITGVRPRFYEVDLLDRGALRAVFSGNKIDSVIHFAGLKAVGESCAQPLRYYHNNITGTLNLCDVMAEFGVKRLVFSSSATVYGNPATVPIREDFPLSTTNPYGQTKLVIERILSDLAAADPAWSISVLRYFNPIGAHKSGLIGEDPRGIPNNLLPYIVKVSAGKLERLNVFGNDYDTHDGTGVRDYIHVVDLARAHLKALALAETKCGVDYFNVGTGVGYSVLDIVRAYEAATGRPVPYQIVGRRPGDIAVCYADPAKAAAELGWRAEYGIDEMCRDAANWQEKNPDGYPDA